VTRYRIPFNKPCLTGAELRYITEAVERGQVSGGGEFTARCEKLLETALGVHRALLTPSCTAALEMCGLLLDLQPGDEVVLPSFAFVTTANAFALRGARPVFADIRSDTLNLDERSLDRYISPRTRAVVALHYAGVGCEMDAIMKTAEEAEVPVVEDNAHGTFGRYKGRFLGSFGCLATLSFHETKNFTCGEGGALLLNRPELVERAEVVHQKGTNRARFLRGEVEKYTWVDFGSSYLPSEIQAAFLLAQLEARDRILADRERIWHRYASELREWAETHGVGLPRVPEHCSHPAHMFHLLLPSSAARSRLIDHLRKRGILAVFHFLPLHLSEMGRRFGGRAGDCPVAESTSERLLRLPFYNGLTHEEQSEVVAAVQAFDEV
jgi:dTDP-4-amino-4,6-dideoxygalactose transaminase